MAHYLLGTDGAAHTELFDPHDNYRPQEIRKRAKLAPSTLKRWRRIGKLKGFWFGGLWRASGAELNALIAETK